MLESEKAWSKVVGPLAREKEATTVSAFPRSIHRMLVFAHWYLRCTMGFINTEQGNVREGSLLCSRVGIPNGSKQPSKGSTDETFRRDEEDLDAIPHNVVNNRRSCCGRQGSREGCGGNARR